MRDLGNSEAKHDILNNVESCENWTGKFWTLAVISERRDELQDGEDEISFMKCLSELNGWNEKPRFFGVLCEVPEIIVAVRCTEAERCRKKDIVGLGNCVVSPLSLRKGGQQGMRLLGIFVQLFGMCCRYSMTLSIRDVFQPTVGKPSTGLALKPCSPRSSSGAPRSS
jgi:hypothetical protein